MTAVPRLTVRGVARTFPRGSRVSAPFGTLQQAPEFSPVLRLQQLPAALLSSGRCSQFIIGVRCCSSKTQTEVPAQADSTSESSGSADPGDGSSTTSSEPQVLWTAREVNKDLADAEEAVTRNSFLTASGIGFALLGIAPYTAPFPQFTCAILLATFSVRFAHTSQIRQLRANCRRHVTHLTVSESEGTTVLNVTCGDHLSRTLYLSAARGDKKEKRPSMASIFKHGKAFICFDDRSGSSEAQESLDELFKSNMVIEKEELNINQFPDESKEEAASTIQRLVSLTVDQVKNLEGKTLPEPKDCLDGISRTSQIVAGISLIGGAVIGISGRASSESGGRQGY